MIGANGSRSDPIASRAEPHAKILQGLLPASRPSSPRNRNAWSISPTLVCAPRSDTNSSGGAGRAVEQAGVDPFGFEACLPPLGGRRFEQYFLAPLGRV